MWPPPPGTKVSKYRLDRLLGAGGMGSVYLAHDVDLDRDVAIKFISPERAADPTARRRLVHEARAAAALDHPNICAVHDVVVEPDGNAFIVMQYVEGETLARRLEEGPLDPRQALLVATDVASALSAAHRRGIVHRDVKPQNIIITPSGRAKLLDFGIARLDEPAGAHSTTATRLTGPGRGPGTPAYMSPEQLQQQPLDGRSDLFSLGAVVYECLTGRQPFDGASEAEIYLRILQEHPPAVSAIRNDVGEREDELCRRLLAKHPDDRFASADELLGALRVLAPDTSHSSGGSRPSVHERRDVLRAMAASARSRRFLAGLLVVGLLAVAGVWRWRAGSALPPAPPDAERWYVKGTQLIHDGAYHSGRLALEEAVRIFPEYALAYARLAEAYTELDESDNAERALLTVDRLVPNRGRLPTDDRLRLDAVRAIVLHDPAAALKAYAELAERRKGDPAVWVDLGRAQEVSAPLAHARASYEQAIAIDRHYAAAHLRRGSTLMQTQRDEALREFDEAERLYRAASNVEGETEALLGRGGFLLSIGRIGGARAALERARAFAISLKNRPQELRASLRLSAVTAVEGRLSEARQLAAAAIDQALSSGFETVAADGLIDLVITLLGQQRPEEAELHVRRAVQLAEKVAEPRLLARTRLQLAAVLIALNRPADALALARQSLEVMRAQGYRRYELIGMLIAARAHEQLTEYAGARSLAAEALRLAEALEDEPQIVLALDNLAGTAAGTGALPEALAYRERREAMVRAQKNVLALAFDLTNRAELLIRLGRPEEAEQALAEIDKGIAAGVEPFKTRGRRLLLLRAYSAVLSHRFAQAASAASTIVQPGQAGDQWAKGLLTYANARIGRLKALPPPPEMTDSPEGFFWDLAARLASGDAKTVLEEATGRLERPEGIASYEYEWRLAALAAAAARRVGAEDRARDLTARARRGLDRLRAEWRDHAAAYLAIPYITQLIREAGLQAST
jgi:tetratricopeptide (TPR) repeat protein